MLSEIIENEWRDLKFNKIRETISCFISQQNIEIDLSGDRLFSFMWVVANTYTFTTDKSVIDMAQNWLTTLDIISLQPKDDMAPWAVEMLSYTGSYESMDGKDLTPAFIQQNPHYSWDWGMLSHDRFTNFSFDLVKDMPDKDWNWGILSHKNSLTMGFIRDNLGFPWVWKYFCFVPDVTMDFINENVDEELDWDMMSESPNLTCEFVKKHVHEPWDWNKLSWHNNMTFDFIGKNLKFPWDWFSLSCRKEIPLAFLKSHMSQPWHWSSLIEHSNLTFEFVDDDMDEKYWNILSKHPELSFKLVERHINKRWSWSLLSRHANLTEEFLLNNTLRPWDWKSVFANGAISPSCIINNIAPHWSENYDGLFRYLSQNENVTCKTIEENIDKNWIWSTLSIRNKHITCEFVEKHINKPWSFWGLSVNDNIKLSLEFIEAHLDEDWQWGDDENVHHRDRAGLSECDAVTGDFINRHLDKPWDWNRLIGRNENLTSEFFLEHLDDEAIMAYDDAHQWYYVLMNQHNTFGFIDDRILTQRNDMEDIGTDSRLNTCIFYNKFEANYEKATQTIRRREFMKLGGLFNEIVEYICKPPSMDTEDYDSKMEKFILKMHNLGLEEFDEFL